MTCRPYPLAISASDPHQALPLAPRHDAPNPLFWHVGPRCDTSGGRHSLDVDQNPRDRFHRMRRPHGRQCERGRGAPGRACYWGCVGDDDLGTRILDQLTAESVDVAAARRIPGCVSPSAAILADTHGERLVCAYNDPNLDPDPSWLPFGQIANCHALLADVRWPARPTAAFDAAARQASSRYPTAMSAHPKCFPTSRVGQPMPSFRRRDWRRPREGPNRATDSKRSRAVPGLVGVTLGPDVFLRREGSCERRIPAPKVVAIDTLAAGDDWRGAFTLALVEGRDDADAGRFTIAAAAIKCSRAGGRIGAPSRGEVMKLLAAEW